MVKIQEEDKKKYDDGYNSDGEQGPFFNTINIEREQDFEEDEVVKEVTDYSDMPNDSEDSTSDPPRNEDIPPDAFRKLKVLDLKEELKKWKQLTVGFKKVLLERLELSLNNKVPLSATTPNKK